MGKVLPAICAVTLLCSAQAQVRARLCDLIDNPEKYRGTEVTVRATYHTGFEWSWLSCLECPDRGKVWLAFSDDLDKGSERGARKTSKTGMYNLTVTGMFEGPGGYGHMNGFRYLFTAHKVENVVVLLKGMRSSEEQEAAQKRSGCGGEKPK